MATLANIEKDIAGLMGLTVADFTPSGLNSLSLAALNKVRRRAELSHDFEFSRKLVELNVDGATGGSLLNAKLHSDGTTAVTVKSVLEVGVFDEDDNLRPVLWTTVAEGLERQRKDNRGNLGWWGARDDQRAAPFGGARFEFSGTDVFSWPKDSTADYVLGLEVYSMQADWTAADLTGVATVAGSGTSAINGTYTLQGTYNSFPLFVKLTSGYALWNTGTVWKITTANQISTAPADFYSLTSSSQSPAGSYVNNGALTGTVTVVDGTSSADIWAQYATDYLVWATAEELNYRFKKWVARTEGNLPPPSQLVAQALAAFIDWDSNFYEQFRRHSR